MSQEGDLACSTTNSATALPASINVSSSVVVSPLSRLAELRPPPRPNPDRRRARPYEPGACAHPSSSHAHLRLQDSSTPCSTCASCACGQVAPDPRASASRCPTPWPDPVRKLLVTGAVIAPHDRAHRRVRFQSCGNRWPRACPRSARAAPATSNTQANTAACVSRSISRRVREIVEWSGVASSSAMPTKRRSASESAKRPGDAALGSDAFEIPYQQRAKVNARRPAKDVQTAAHRT